MSIVNKLMGTAKRAASSSGKGRGTTGATGRPGKGRSTTGGSTGGGVVGKVLGGLRKR